VEEGAIYRLPTEAEWEYACRAGTSALYHFGDDALKLDEYAWFKNNANDVGHKYAHRVGRKKPNPFGLFDIHGNVWEWCADYYESDYYANSPLSDPPGPTWDRKRVYRGGGWRYNLRSCRSSFRYSNSPFFRDYGLGFRVARIPSGG